MQWTEPQAGALSSVGHCPARGALCCDTQTDSDGCWMTLGTGAYCQPSDGPRAVTSRRGQPCLITDVLSGVDTAHVRC